MVFDEARLVHTRLNRYHAAQVSMLRLAVGSLFGKEAGRHFQKAVRELVEE